MQFYNKLLIKLKYTILKNRFSAPVSINPKIQELIFKRFDRNILSIIEICKQNKVIYIFTNYLFNTVTRETNSALNVLSDKHNFILLNQVNYLK